MIVTLPGSPLNAALSRSADTAESAQKQHYELLMRDVARILRDALPAADALTIDVSNRYVPPDGVQLHAIRDTDDQILWIVDAPLPSPLAAYRTPDGYQWKDLVCDVEERLTSAIGTDRPDNWWESEDNDRFDTDLYCAALPNHADVIDAGPPGYLAAKLADLDADGPVLWLAQPTARPTMTVAGVQITAYRGNNGSFIVEIGTHDAQPPLEIPGDNPVAIEVLLNRNPLYRPDQATTPAVDFPTAYR